MHFVLAACRRSDIVVIGFAWGVSDERKMQSTFGLGKAMFCHFVDLNTVAEAMGYIRCSLGRLSELVLGIVLHKSSKVSLLALQIL